MIINLWSGPRNVSTALMYSFANRGDCKVIDEPFYAHYLNLTGLDHPGRKEILASQSTEQKHVWNDVVFANYSEKHLFVKNMAHHSIGLDLDRAAKMKTVFLLREPNQTITSFIKQIPNPTMQDLAYKHQWELCQKVKNPIVVDSKDLLQHPENYMKCLCEVLDIDFTENMLSWNKGAIAEDGAWAKYWYASVHKSTEFQTYQRKEEKVPERLNSLLEAANDYYSELIKYKL